jgi:hypothetical protein
VALCRSSTDFAATDVTDDRATVDVEVGTTVEVVDVERIVVDTGRVDATTSVVDVDTGI